MESDRRPEQPPSEPAADEAPGGPYRPGPLRTAAFLSGITALVAQIVWVRALGRAVGTTTEALAAVAAVFLGGLGLGAALGGRLAATTADPARAAGRCLLGAAVLVLVSPWLFDVLPGLHLLVLDLLGQQPGPSPWPALLVGLPLLLVPTVLMGATFPLLLAARRSAAAHVGRGTGGLYALNTLGAALGTLVTVVALMAWGERLTLTAAAGLEIAAGAALLLAGARGATPDPAHSPREPAQRVRAHDLPTPLGLRLVLTLTGFVGLGVEVAAFRLLEPITGPHLWGVSLLLVPVLLGIALGGWIGGVVADRVPSPARALASTLALAGALVAASLWVAGLLPWLLFAGDAAGGGARMLGLAAGTALVLLPPLTALGATFPLAVRAAALRGIAPARAGGDLTAWNAAGAVAGSLCVGFFALPAVGAATTLLTLAWFLPAGGALLRLAMPGGKQVLPALATALPLLLLALPFVQGPLLAAAPQLPQVVALNRRSATPDAAGRPPALPRLRDPADVRLYAEWYGGRPVKVEGVAGEPFGPREGRLGSVALLQEPSGSIRLRVNALSEARFVPDRPDTGSTTEVALGLLPALAHPGPKRALVIGHGAGWTVEAVLATDIPWVDVAELDETLLDVVEEWRGLRPDGTIRPLQVRTDRRAHLRLTDGRLLLRLAADDPALRYDVIASQPSHPWVPGAGHLFTREAYTLARGALTEGGVFAQWLNLFEMSEELLKASLATFRDVFPTCWLFLFQREAVLLGFAGEPRIDTARWERQMEAGGPVRVVSEPAGIRTPGDLWSRLTLDGPGLERLAPAASTRLVVDDRPQLELGLAWRVLQNAADEDLERFLRREFPPDLAPLVPDRHVRDRWTAFAIDSLLTEGQIGTALLWDDKVTWGTDPTSRIVRAAVARARGEMPRAETILRGVVDELARGPAAELTAHGDWVSGWIGLLAEIARESPALRARLLEDAAAVAERLPKDGRVRAAMAYLRESANDLEGARLEYAEALAAKDPPAPPGTARDLARLVLALSDRPAAPTGAPAPGLGDDVYLLDLLRSDPGTWGHRDSLDLLARLETRLGSALEAERAEAALQTLDEKEAVAAFRSAWGSLPEGRGNGLEDAERAAVRAPTWVDAWELVALVRLQRHALAEHPGEKDQHRREALYALGRAWESAKDRAAEERRARTILGWYGVSGADLKPIEVR